MSIKLLHSKCVYIDNVYKLHSLNVSPETEHG